MIDRIRLLWNRPLQDGDRPRLFALVVTLIAAAAAVPTLIERQGPPARAERADGVPTAAAPAPATALRPAASASPAGPSEEGTRTPVAASPADVAACKRAARRFAGGYLRYAYARGRVRDIASATAALRRRLAAQRPRVPNRERRSAPRLVLLQSDSVGHDRAQLVALVDDGRRRYTVSLQLVRVAAGWKVDGAGS